MSHIPLSHLFNQTFVANQSDLNLTMMPHHLNSVGHQLSQGHQLVYAANLQPTVAAVQANSAHQQQQHEQKKTNKAKKPKVNKDGVPAPKRAATPFIKFTQWRREELKKNGTAVPKFAEFGKECSAMWSNMSEEDKKPFTDASSRDSDRYKREMTVYQPVRDESKPKRPGTPFMLFMVDLRKEMAGKEPEGGVTAMAKLGGERWRNMTEEEKRPYVDKQNSERVRYDLLMEDYRRKGEQTIAATGVKAEESESPQTQNQATFQQVDQAAVQQIHLAPATTSYLLTDSGVVYSGIPPYPWN